MQLKQPIAMFDYYNNHAIKQAITDKIRFISNPADKEDCEQEIFTELYSFCPFSEDEAIVLIKKAAQRFIRQESEHSRCYSLDDILE